MPRSPATLVALLCTATALACTDAAAPASSEPAPTPPPMPTLDPATPAPATAPDPATAPATAFDPATIEQHALACAGVALASALAGLDEKSLTGLAAGTEHPSARLLARWELVRSFAADGSLEPAAVEAIVQALTAELGSKPPTWWSEQLASAKRGADEPPYYDVGLRDDADRRGSWVPGPGTTKVRPGVAMQLSGADGKLFFDLSMGRVELGPLPSEPDAVLEVGRARAGSTIYYASFPRGSGGFRFPLRAVASSGRELWTAEVCGPDRNLLGGQGYLTAEIVVLQAAPEPGTEGMKLPSGDPKGIAVFTAESHGVALDVFDVDSGARVLAWSSDLWFSR